MINNTNTNALKIGVIAGVVSALLPSVPTIVKFSNDDTPVKIPIINITMPYNKFLFIWIGFNSS